MRKAALVVLCSAASCFAQTPAAAQEKSSIEGHVASLTGEPLRKVTVRLQTVLTGPPAAGGVAQPTVFTGETDAQGNFAIADVDPGRYSLSAERSGYVRETYRERGVVNGTVSLAAGQRLTGIAFKLSPQAVVSGKVTDEDGDPVQGARVNVLKQAWINGKRQFQPSGTASAGPDGAYAVGNLAAGRYYVNASDPRMNQFEAANSHGPSEGYLTTYYPNVIDTAAAVPVDVAAGNEMRGMDIRMRKGRVFRIRGHVNAAVDRAATMVLAIVPRDGFIMTGIRTAPVHQDGTFVFDRVPPGEYSVQLLNSNVRNPDGTVAPPLTGRANVSITDADVDNVLLAFGAGADITGTVTIVGSTQPAQPQQQAAAPGANLPLRVALNPDGVLLLNAGPANAETKPDGTFAIRGVGPAAYRVNVLNLPPGTYVKSVRFGGQDITNSKLDLSGGTGGELAIVLSATAASLAGTVHGPDGAALPGVNVSLWVPGVPTAGAVDPARGAITDQNGTFRLQNLPPAEYRLAAWEQIEPGLSGVPEFRAKFDSVATTVKLAENANETADAVLISREAIDTEAAKIR